MYPSAVSKLDLIICGVFLTLDCDFHEKLVLKFYSTPWGLEPLYKCVVGLIEQLMAEFNLVEFSFSH